MLRNKTLIITGASQGIGAALARSLAERGANLVLNARSAVPLAETATACRAHGVRVLTVTGSTASSTVARRLAEEAVLLSANGTRFSGFIHAAGVLAPGPLLAELPKKTFTEVMDASVTAAYQLIRHTVPRLRGTPDALAVFFGSGSAEIAQPGIAAYCAAKAAEEHLARQLHAEEPDIATLVYRPGIVETRMQSQARISEGGGAEQLQAVFRPWHENGHLLTPEQSADYLAGLLEKPADLWRGRTVRVGDVL